MPFYGMHNNLMHDSLLILGVRGERMIRHFTFYTAFNTPEEYRLEHEGGSLGSIPVTMPLAVGRLVLFAGKRWEVLHVAEEEKRISFNEKHDALIPKELRDLNYGAKFFDVDSAWRWFSSISAL